MHNLDKCPRCHSDWTKTPLGVDECKSCNARFDYHCQIFLIRDIGNGLGIVWNLQSSRCQIGTFQNFADQKELDIGWLPLDTSMQAIKALLAFV